MARDILNPGFWAERMRTAKYDYQALYHCSPVEWEAISREHIKLLEVIIQPDDSVLDIGCAWGRLLMLMPDTWRRRNYVGVDLTPAFIQRARMEHPEHTFICGGLLDVLPGSSATFDIAVAMSMRSMISANLGVDHWNLIERELRRMCKRVLYLEYDVQQPGKLEIFS